jgi:hypothetical protein
LGCCNCSFGMQIRVCHSPDFTLITQSPGVHTAAIHCVGSIRGPRMNVPVAMKLALEDGTVTAAHADPSVTSPADCAWNDWCASMEIRCQKAAGSWLRMNVAPPLNDLIYMAMRRERPPT